MDRQYKGANNAVAEVIDFYIDVVPVTELFTPRNKGNEELYLLFGDIFISEKLFLDISKQVTGKSIDCHICHREVYDAAHEEFQSRLVACSESRNAKIEILSNRMIKASCFSCCSTTSTSLDSGYLDLCKHEISLLIGIDYQMSKSSGHYSNMRTKRMEAMKTRRIRILEQLSGVCKEKALLLSLGVTNIEKDYSAEEQM